MAGRCLHSYSGGKIKRDLRATNPKSERRKRGSNSSRPTDGRNGQKDGWMMDGQREGRKQGAHRYARVRRAATATMADHCLSACLLLLRLIILHFI